MRAGRRKRNNHARTLPESKRQTTPPLLAKTSLAQPLTKAFGTPSYTLFAGMRYTEDLREVLLKYDAKLKEMAVAHDAGKQPGN